MTMCLSPNGPLVTELEAPPTRLLVATLRGVGVVERSGPGAPWRSAGTTHQGHHISSLMRIPGQGGIVAGAHSGGLFYSADQGATWERRTNGLTIDHVFCLHHATHGGRVSLYAGTEPVGLFRSDDFGLTWHELPTIKSVPGAEKWTFPPPPHIAHTKSLTFDARDPDTIYLCVEQGGLLKSRDGGRTWVELDSYYRADDRTYRDVHRIVPMPSNADELFMPSGIGLFHSLDAGLRWEKLFGNEARLGYPDHLLLSPSNENVMYLSGSGAPPSTWRESHKARGTVMRSTDRGRTWSPADHGLPQDNRANMEAMAAAQSPGGFLMFLGDTDGNVWCSEDETRNWQKIATGFAPVSKVGHYRFLQDVPAVA